MTNLKLKRGLSLIHFFSDWTLTKKVMPLTLGAQGNVFHSECILMYSNHNGKPNIYNLTLKANSSDEETSNNLLRGSSGLGHILCQLADNKSSQEKSHMHCKCFVFKRYRTFSVKQI